MRVNYRKIYNYKELSLGFLIEMAFVIVFIILAYLICLLMY